MRFSPRKIQGMKGPLRFRLLVMTGTVGLALAGPAFANHKTGDFPLPELIVAADFNEDGKLDLAVNVTGFDNVAIGTVALYQNTIGYDNTAGGARSLSSRP